MWRTVSGLGGLIHLPHCKSDIQTFRGSFWRFQHRFANRSNSVNIFDEADDMDIGLRVTRGTR